MIVVTKQNLRYNSYDMKTKLYNMNNGAWPELRYLPAAMKVLQIVRRKCMHVPATNPWSFQCKHNTSGDWNLDLQTWSQTFPPFS